MSMVQFPHQLFKEFMVAKYLASLHSSDHDKYEKIMADILEKKEEFRYLLYFTSAQGRELGLDTVTRLIAQETTATSVDEASGLPMVRWSTLIDYKRQKLQERNEYFLVDIAYESQHPSVAEKVGNQFMGSRKTLEISEGWSAHTLSGLLFIKDHLGEVVIQLVSPFLGKTYLNLM